MILRYTAFTDTPDGGNPAGVVLDATGMSAEEMLKIAADLGYSETAFATPRADGDYDVRYFSPEAEVPFCGHATIATGVAFAERDGAGPRVFHTMAGAVPVETSGNPVTATLTSVVPHVEEVPEALLDAALTALALDARRTRPGPPAAGRLRRRPPPDPRRRHARAAGRPRLRLRRPQAVDARARPHDGRPRPPHGRAHVQRPQPVPGRRGRRGSGHGCGGRRVRGLPARTRTRDATGDRDRPPGRRHGPAEPADDRHRRAPRDPRQRSRGGDVSDR